MNDISMGSSFDSFTANLIKSFFKFSIELVLFSISQTFLSKISRRLSFPLTESLKNEHPTAADAKSSNCNF